MNLAEPLVRAAASDVAAASILCVDDEPNILSSLRRLLRPMGYQVLLAESGSAALAMLETREVDLVISDMRMPEMDGAHFLEQVRANWPDTIRLLLTGYADVQSILAAINNGEIYRYVTKPWNDNDIQLIVRHALERRELEREKRRLEALTRRQNEELKELNASLEIKVQERTADLNEALDALVAANGKLKDNFVTSIKMFSGLVGMRSARLEGHSHRVADLARRIAGEMEMDKSAMQDVFVAGLVHNLGKVAFSDDLLNEPVTTMSAEHLGQYRKYPQRGEQLLMPLTDLQEVARIVRSQQERFDGAGFPDGLSGFNIPLGARVLALASDYFNLQIGTLAPRKMRPEEAFETLVRQSGKRYDPAVVKAFRDVLYPDADGRGAGAPGDALAADEVVVATAALRPGMVVLKDLLSRDGLLLLSANHELDDKLIHQLREFEKSPAGSRLAIHVRVEGEHHETDHAGGR